MTCSWSSGTSYGFVSSSQESMSTSHCVIMCVSTPGASSSESMYEFCHGSTKLHQLPAMPERIAGYARDCVAWRAFGFLGKGTHVEANQDDPRPFAVKNDTRFVLIGRQRRVPLLMQAELVACENAEDQI